MFRSTFAVVVAALGLSLTGSSAQAGSFEHIDSLATQLQSQSRSLMIEFRSHYRHTEQYPHLSRDARQMYELASHVHEVVHSGNVSHLRHDLQELDTLFHHVEELVARTEFHADDYHGYHGHVHGNTGHVRRILSRMEDTLHHLQEDVNSLAYTVPAPVQVRRPVVVVSPSGHGHGGGIRFSNGRVGFSIGF